MITLLFDLLVAPFGDAHTVALAALSLLTGVGMAVAFKKISDEGAIRRAKDAVRGRILEMRIYQDDPGLIVRAFAGTMLANLFYTRAMLAPTWKRFLAFVFVLILPVLIIFIQLDERFAHRHLDTGESTVLSVQLKEGLDPFTTPVQLSGDGGVTVETRPVRVAQSREIDWRLRVARPGTHTLTVSSGSGTYTVPVTAEVTHNLVGHTRAAGNVLQPLLHPGLAPIPEESPFARIHITYPGARYPLLTWHVHWIVMFMVYSLVGALAMKFVIKFEI